MSNTFGAPIYIFSADESTAGGKQSSRLKEIIQALLPLEKAQDSLQKAAEALGDTSYEQIVSSINAVIAQITSTTQQITAQLSGSTQTPAQGNPASAQQAPSQMTEQAAGKPSMLKTADNPVDDLDAPARRNLELESFKENKLWMQALSAQIQQMAREVIHLRGDSKESVDFWENLEKIRGTLAQSSNPSVWTWAPYVSENELRTFKSALQFLSSSVNVAIGSKQVMGLMNIGDEVKKQLGPK